MDEKEFHLDEYLASLNKEKGLNNNQDRGFKQLIRDYDRYIDEQDKVLTDKEKELEIIKQHEAIIGIPEAIQYIKDKINDFIVKNNQGGTGHPYYYSNLVDAIFHERFGLGPLSTWSNYPYSQAAQVIGTDIYFRINGRPVMQNVKFESIERVMDICRSLTMKSSTARLNERNPSLQIDMHDGTRVTITISPKTQVPTLTFRRFVIREFSFEKQAELNTIPFESIPLFRALSLCRPNKIISGPVRAGKTTFMKTDYAERNGDDSAVVLEPHFEFYGRRDFPNRPLIEYQSSTREELEADFRLALRQDPEYILLPETRSFEAEIYVKACERGSSGSTTTHHTTYAVNIPGLFARHIVDSYPGRNYNQELIRVADVTDFVICMEEMKDGSKKVTSVEEVVLDPYSFEVSTVVIMQFDHETNDWTYHNHLSPRLFEKMRKYNREHAELYAQTLRKLSEKKPYQGEAKRISLASLVM